MRIRPIAPTSAGALAGFEATCPECQMDTMTFEQLLDMGWTPPADDLHDDLNGPERGEPRGTIRGTFATTGREAGYEKRRGSYR